MPTRRALAYPGVPDVARYYPGALPHSHGRASEGLAPVWNNLGSLLHRQRDFAGAEDAYRNALGCDAGFAPALDNLARLLCACGRETEAVEYACRAFVQPPLAGKSPQMLGIAHYSLGCIAEAAACYRAWLQAEPGNAVARHFLAACSGTDVPARASDGFVTAVFDDMAESFDAKLVGKLSYRGPEIVAALLDGVCVAGRGLDILDGGCGTGLCAAVLAPWARRLVGVDLSRRMLDKAHARGLFDELAEAELTAYLTQQRAAFDIVVMADTLIYFGELTDLFAATRQALRCGGYFAFTVESALPPHDYRLEPSGRYRHSRRYLEQRLAAAGFEALRGDDVFLRSELGRPIEGIGMLARLSN